MTKLDSFLVQSMLSFDPFKSYSKKIEEQRSLGRYLSTIYSERNKWVVKFLNVYPVSKESVSYDHRGVFLDKEIQHDSPAEAIKTMISLYRKMLTSDSTDVTLHHYLQDSERKELEKILTQMEKEISGLELVENKST